MKTHVPPPPPSTPTSFPDVVTMVGDTKAEAWPIAIAKKMSVSCKEAVNEGK